MCGIAGCVGHEKAPEFVVSGLETLQYRGYDSAGVAYQSPGGLVIAKTIGKPSLLRDRLDLDEANETSLGVALGHNRWATHGEVNLPNAHPHTNESKTIASVCNGVIENHKELREDLISDGYSFTSETDTEVIPHLIDRYMSAGQEPEEAFRKALKDLTGSYAVLMTLTGTPDELYAAQFYSPVVLGVNGASSFAASSIKALAGHARKDVEFKDEEIAILSAGKLPRIINARSLRRCDRLPQDFDGDAEKVDKIGFEHFMLKEIHETPDTIRNAIRGRVHPESNQIKLGGLESVEERLQETDRFIIVACGTSYYAGMIGERLIEEIAGIPVEVDLASEFIYKEQPIDKNTAVIAISQSGETADTRAALRKADELGLLKLGIVNSLGSGIYKETEAGVYCHAGSEISVASTKAFISQVTVLTEMALALSKRSNRISQPLMQELTQLPKKIETMLADTSAIQAAAKRYANYEHFMFIGRGYNYPAAMEGALKLKEVSYIQAEGYGAGEMKHGPLAMIDENFPTVAIATDGAHLDKTMSNIEEIRTRKGPVLALATEGNNKIGEIANDVIYVPASLEQTQPILNAVALQLFAYYVARELGHDIDQPRNLAKSVTVE